MVKTTSLPLPPPIRYVLNWDQPSIVSEIQYISVDSKDTMQPMAQSSEESGANILLACKIGMVRLSSSNTRRVKKGFLCLNCF